MAEAKRQPKHNEIEVSFNSSYSVFVSCEKNVCARGWGLSVECGTTVSFGTKIECQPCIPGETFSNRKDYTVCKECHICHENQEVLRQCTMENQTMCGKCKAGYYDDDVTRNCLECAWCCEGSEGQRRMPQCSNMDVQKQCRWTTNSDSCKPPTPSNDNVTSGPPPTTTTPPPTTTTPHHKGPTLQTAAPAASQPENQNLVLGITSLSLATALAVVVAAWKGRHVMRCKLRQARIRFCEVLRTLRRTHNHSANIDMESSAQTAAGSFVASNGDSGERLGGGQPSTSGNVNQHEEQTGE